MSDLIKPEDFTIEYENEKGDTVSKTFILSNFDAVTGREIISLYPTTMLPPKFGGEYKSNKEIMNKLMSFVAIRSNGVEIRLTTDELINNHCTTWEILAKVETEMMKKNCSFFRDGRSWDFLENLTQVFLKRLSETLTPSLDSLSPTDIPSTI